MTKNELLRRFPNASEEFIKRNMSSDSGTRTHHQLQEQEARGDRTKEGREQICNELDSSKCESLDGEFDSRFRITIVWLISDKRRRDSWGMSETIADCIVSASRRFLGLDDTRTAKNKKS